MVDDHANTLITKLVHNICKDLEGGHVDCDSVMKLISYLKFIQCFERYYMCINKQTLFCSAASTPQYYQWYAAMYSPLTCVS